jgi:hypothetical protein
MVNVAILGGKVRTTDIVTFAAGILILCGSSLVGVISSFFFGLAFLILWIQQEKLGAIFVRRDLWVVAIVTGALLTGLATYYAWTLSVGARASSVGETNLLTFGFIFYEMLGFAGLGPGRNDLRENAIAALKPYLPALLIYGLILTLFIFSFLFTFFKNPPLAIKSLKHSGRPMLLIVAAAVAAGLCVFLMGILKDFRVIGRHLMPIFPFVLLGFSCAAAYMWNSRKAVLKSSVLLVLIASAVSALSIRFSPRHAKDDYRSAAAVALETLGKEGTVWWAADEAGGKYYNVRLISTDEIPAGERSGIVVSRLNFKRLSSLPSPDLVIISKPDIYDPRHEIRNFCIRNGLSSIGNPKAFSLYGKEHSR